MKEDKELYREFIDGNEEALNELITKYRTELIHFIQKYVYDYQTAEDVSQEVFIYLLKHKDVYDFKYPFRTYLYTIAKSRALNKIKSNKKYVYIEDDPEYLSNAHCEFEEDVFRKEENLKVRKALSKLKGDYQAAIYLVDFNGMTYDETAVILDKNMGQVKALLHNGRKRLKTILEKEMNMDFEEMFNKKPKEKSKEEVAHSEIDGRVH